MKVKVTNRDSGAVGYVIPDANIHRTFASGQTKEIDLEELKQVQFIPGGQFILDNLLIVEDSALAELNMEVEPEYKFTETDIRKMLSYETDMDRFLDFLDYAPEGALEICKEIMVNEKIPDTRKREALSAKTGFNVDAAIMVNNIMAEEESEENTDSKPKRRVASEEGTDKPARRSKYTKVE